MNSDASATKKRRPVLKIIALAVFGILIIAAILLYKNFNRLLTDALTKSYSSTIISDVYELKFENLRVNVFEGSIKVLNVSFLPREKPLHDYPYINSSFRLTTEQITLENVEIRLLLKEHKLNLKRISITKPKVEVTLTGKRHIMLPFSDTTTTSSTQKANNKKSLDEFLLKEFQLIDATFHTINSEKQREFKIDNFNLSVYDLLLNQAPGEYKTSTSQVALSMGELRGQLQKDAFQEIGFKDFKIGVDSLAVQFTLDTLMYRFHDFKTGLSELDIQTADSLFHIAVNSFDLSYKDKSVKVSAVSFKPNVSHAVLQRKYNFQHTEFSGTVGTLDIHHFNFDTLIYYKKLFIDEIILDQVKASVFKDKTKPIDSARRPVYLGQTVSAISLPLRIRHVKATHVQLDNTERKPDSTYAKVNITQATLDVLNLTNLSPRSLLVINADAYIEDKAHVKVGLTFPYHKQEFSFEGVVEKFNLPDLNPLIQAYTPAKITQGVSDEISFVGLAEQTHATGSMKFLYHDLEINLELQEKAKWKSAVITFAANSLLNTSNPISATLPPRIVKFQIDRDMTKGFVNILIKSMLNGLKETMVMSKENRKTYQDAKKKSGKNK